MGKWRILRSGFFVIEPGAIDHIEGDHTVLEREPLERIAAEGQLSMFKHHGFWAAMDTLRDKVYLEDLWANGQAPWKIWR